MVTVDIVVVSIVVDPMATQLKQPVRQPNIEHILAKPVLGTPVVMETMAGRHHSATLPRQRPILN